MLRRAGTCTNTCKLNGMEKKKNATKQIIRERTLSMQEGGPEGFKNFSKNIS